MLPEAASGTSLKGLSKRDAYKEMLDQVQAVLHGERNYIANLSNAAAIIYHGLNGREDAPVNWAGFYLKDHSKDNELVLGPFQGKVACVRIRFGRGVCGTAAQSLKTQLVPNVHDFPGHIACDSASNSEVVVPIVRGNGDVLGVLDLDSSVVNGFDIEDQQGLEAIVVVLVSGCDWP
eukprot:Opistho-2@39215